MCFSTPVFVTAAAGLRRLRACGFCQKLSSSVRAGVTREETQGKEKMMERGVRLYAARSKCHGNDGTHRQAVL